MPQSARSLLVGCGGEEVEHAIAGLIAVNERRSIGASLGLTFERN